MSTSNETSFELLLNIQSYGEEELKSLKEKLEGEEREISKRRRLLHGELDIIRAEIVRRMRDKGRAGKSLFSDGDIERLSAILSARGLPSDQEEPAGETEAEPTPTGGATEAGHKAPGNFRAGTRNNRCQGSEKDENGQPRRRSPFAGWAAAYLELAGPGLRSA